MKSKARAKREGKAQFDPGYDARIIGDHIYRNAERDGVVIPPEPTVEKPAPVMLRNGKELPAIPEQTLVDLIPAKVAPKPEGISSADWHNGRRVIVAKEQPIVTPVVVIKYAPVLHGVLLGNAMCDVATNRNVACDIFKAIQRSYGDKIASDWALSYTQDRHMWYMKVM